MNSTRTLRLAFRFAAIATIAWAGAARAQAPSGSFRYQFAAGSGPPLYNFSGSYSAPFLASNALVTIYQNGKGQLFGSEGPFPSGSPNLEITGTVSGSVRNGRTNLAVRLTGNVWLSLSSSGNNGLDETGIQRKDAMSLVTELEAGTLSGTDKTTAIVETVTYTPYGFGDYHRHVTRQAATSYQQDISLAVLPENDGSWFLDLNLVPDGNRLSGTASIAFPNSRRFQFDLVGSYLPGKAQAKVLLRGAGEDRGARLTLTLATADMSIQSMRGTVGGQRIQFPRP